MIADIYGDKRPKKKFWAPGNYGRRCQECNNEFIGDKRAAMCSDCAYFVPDAELPKPLEQDAT